MLIFPLKKQWYEKIKSGEKTIEYREVKPYWTRRLFNARQKHDVENNFSAYKINESKDTIFEITMPCYLQLGYKPETRLKAKIIKIEAINGKDTDLAIDKPVYAIHLADVREVSK